MTVWLLDGCNLMAPFSMLKKIFMTNHLATLASLNYLEFSKAVQASMLQLHGMASLLGLHSGTPMTHA